MRTIRLRPLFYTPVGAGDVDSVMVQGRWLKRHHKLISPLPGADEIDIEDIRKRFEKSSARIRDLWREMESSVFVEGGEMSSGAKYAECQSINVRRLNCI